MSFTAFNKIEQMIIAAPIDVGSQTDSVFKTESVFRLTAMLGAGTTKDENRSFSYK